MKKRLWVGGLSVLLVVLALPFMTHNPRVRGPSSQSPLASKPGLERLQHFVFIMQENRSFDHYFGTYPGADGIPPGVMLFDPTTKEWVAPFHNPSEFDRGGPHDWDNAWNDIDGGKMDGFLAESYAAKQIDAGERYTRLKSVGATNVQAVLCWHDQREIPNYWNYAHLYALQDRMFEPVASYSLIAHLYMLAAQSDGFVTPKLSWLTWRWWHGGTPRRFTFTQITDRLFGGTIDWKYYVTTGTQPDTDDAHIVGSDSKTKQQPLRFSHWNPLPRFPSVMNNPAQRRRLVETAEFYKDCKAGTLPQVCWVIPSAEVSEHPPNSVRDGMAYVTGLINAAMQSPCWTNSVIFLCWDDWGGFYDHVPPPKLDTYGYGIRVPSLVIGPYIKQGYIDHQTHSFESWLHLLEERFGLVPMTARDENADDMLECFDFSQKPRLPVLLSATREGSPYPQPLQTIEHDH